MHLFLASKPVYTCLHNLRFKQSRFDITKTILVNFKIESNKSLFTEFQWFKIEKLI